MRVVRLEIDAGRGEVRGRIRRQIHVELREARVGADRRAQLLVLVAREIERLVPDKGAAAVDAGLLLIERRDLSGEERGRVVERTDEVIPAVEAEPCSAERVAARLGHGVDHGAVHAAVLGVVAVGFDLELLDVLHAVALVRAAAALVGDVHAVHLILRHVAARRAGLNRARGAARAGNQRDEPEPVAAVDRQAVHLALLDTPGQLGLLGVHERRLALDRDRFRDGRDLQREVERRRVADREPDAFLRNGAEARQLR